MNIPHASVVSARSSFSARFFALVVVLGLVVVACGGKVVTDSVARRGEGGGGEGGDGEGGKGGGTVGSVGTFSPLFCSLITCEETGGTCVCETACSGPDLMALCSQKENDTVVCECHLDGGYLGLCAASGGSICGLPGGCCTSYLAE